MRISLKKCGSGFYETSDFAVDSMDGPQRSMNPPMVYVGFYIYLQPGFSSRERLHSSQQISEGPEGTPERVKFLCSENIHPQTQSCGCPASRLAPSCTSRLRRQLRSGTAAALLAGILSISASTPNSWLRVLS